jgi:hypothetical protein
MKRSGKVAIAAGASVLVLGAGVGVASAATSGSGTPNPSSSASAGEPQRQQQRDRQHDRRGVFRRVLHGEFTLAGPRHRVVDVQRGQVQSVSATSVTVKSRDGYTHTYAVNSDSRIRKDRNRSSIGQVAEGDRVWVVAAHTGSTVLRIGDRGE